MNIFIVIFIILALILLVIHHTEKEHFSSNIFSLIKDAKKINKNAVLTNIDNISQVSLTDTHILQGRNHFLLYNGKPVKKINISKKIELPQSWSGVDLLATHTDTRLFVIKDTRVYFIDDFTVNYSLSDLYPNIKVERWKGIVQHDNETLFFFNDKILFYNNKNKSFTEKLLNNDIPRDYECVFIFPLEPIKDSPNSLLIFLRDGHYFRYDLSTDRVLNKAGIKFRGVFETKSQILDFSTLGNKGIFGPKNGDLLKTSLPITIENGTQSLVIDEKMAGDYRLEVLGAGQKNGGNGARISVDVNLKKGDVLDIDVGQSGMRLPCQETHHEMVANNLNVHASASGSGASTVKINKKPIVIAGGGGGFSSGFINAPLCSHASITDKPNESLVSIPIKKIKFSHPPKEFSAIRNNQKINNLKCINRTDFIFNEPLIDYVFYFKQQINEPVVLEDLNGNQIVIDQDTDKLTPKIVLLEALGFTPLSLNNSSEPIKNTMCKEGNSLLEYDVVNRTGSTEKIKGNVIVYGGYNGGGVASMNIKTAVPYCGGGGGAKGGMSALNSFTVDIDGNKHSVVPDADNNLLVDNKKKFHTPITAGGGGSSFVDANISNSVLNNINDFNSGQGKVVLIKYSNYYGEKDDTELTYNINHQLVGSNYILSQHKGVIDNYRVLNKLTISNNPQYDQLRLYIRFYLNDVSTGHMNPSNLDNSIKIQPVFFTFGLRQILRFDLPNDNALLDTVRPKNILPDIPFNEEFNESRKESILNLNLKNSPLETAGKVSLNSDTLEYTNFFNIKDSRLDLSPSEIYLVIQSPQKNIGYDLLTIECNHEDMDKNDYLFNKILKRDY